MGVRPHFRLTHAHNNPTWPAQSWGFRCRPARPALNVEKNGNVRVHLGPEKTLRLGKIELVRPPGFSGDWGRFGTRPSMGPVPAIRLGRRPKAPGVPTHRSRARSSRFQSRLLGPAHSYGAFSFPSFLKGARSGLFPKITGLLEGSGGGGGRGYTFLAAARACCRNNKDYLLKRSSVRSFEIFDEMFLIF